MNKAHLKWSQKLLRSKNFVLMTDTDGVIYLEGADPDSFTDQVMLRSQAAELQLFITRLQRVAKDHETALAKLGKK